MKSLKCGWGNLPFLCLLYSVFTAAHKGNSLGLITAKFIKTNQSRKDICNNMLAT